MASEQDEQIDDLSNDPATVDDPNSTQTNEKSDSELEKGEGTPPESSDSCQPKDEICRIPSAESLDDDEGDPKEKEEDLESCLEPRPPHLTELEGSESPKDIHKKLLRKVNLMNSNGDTVEHLRSSSSSLQHSLEADSDDQEGHHHQHDDGAVSIPHPPSSLAPKKIEPQKHKNTFSIFKRKGSTSTTSAASSTTGLILENRPGKLPAKSLAEQKKHEKQYQEMMAAAKKKEMRRAEEAVKQEERKKQRDRTVTDLQKQWSEILPKWDKLYNSKKVRDLWWLGLPPGVRGKVWAKAIGNELNISQDLYKICLSRCTDRLKSASTRNRSDSTKSLSRESSVEVIYLDVQRTFPTLGFFQEGGPYHSTLHDVLGAYACYRPDIGYVQGMSFIAAVLLLNMDAPDAFICLANLLNRSSYLVFFRMEHKEMIPYFEAYDLFFKENLSQVHAHLKELNFKPEFYLIEWIFTIYTRVLPLDLACRVWDLFCRDGEIFLYRTALGLIKLYQSQIMSFTSIEEVGHFLGHIPESTDSDVLFHTINTISISDKKFKRTLTLYQSKHE